MRVQIVTKKVIFKDKFINPVSTLYARRECEIHYLMNNENIIKLYEYNETPHVFNMYMEFADQSNYLEKKLYEVNIFGVKNPVGSQTNKERR